MQKINKKTFAALIKALIILSKYEPEEEMQQQYSNLLGKLCRKYNRNPRVREITAADEFDEFRQVKDQELKKDLIVILVGAAFHTELRIMDAEKYHYLAGLIRALDE